MHARAHTLLWGCVVLPQGNLCWAMQYLLAFLGFSNTVKRIANAPTLEEQRQIYDNTLLVSAAAGLCTEVRMHLPGCLGCCQQQCWLCINRLHW